MSPKVFFSFCFKQMNKALLFLAECSPRLLPTTYCLCLWTPPIQASLELLGIENDLKIILEIGYLATFLIVWKFIKAYFIYN